MEDKLINLADLFHRNIFRIPDYQRGYAWSTPQLQDFWDDINQLHGESKHYIGVLTLEPVSKDQFGRWEDDTWIINEKTYSPHYVVDGQQRLTTIIILIQVIIEYMQQTEKKYPRNNVKFNHFSIAEIQKQYIFESKDNGITRSYIFGYEKDNPSYEYLKTKIFKQRSSSNSFEETSYTKNLLNAKNFFNKMISQLTFDEIEIIFQKITLNVLFNIFSIAKEIDVCVTFETMNNRGKPLSHLELLKNRLIYLSIKLMQPCLKDNETNSLRKDINNCWKHVYHFLGKDNSGNGKNNIRNDKKLNDDLFLLYHTLAYFEGITNEIFGNDRFRMYDGGFNGQIEKISEFLLKKKFITKNINDDTGITIETINDYSHSIMTYVNVWYNYWNYSSTNYTDELKLWIGRINRLISNSSIDWDTLLPFVFNRLVNYIEQQELLIDLLRNLETYLVLLFFLKYRFREMDKDDKNMVSIISTCNTNDGITDNIKYINRNIDILKKYLSNIDINRRYGDKLIEYILFEYEQYLQEKSLNKTEKIDWVEYNNYHKDASTIEHIYPQKPKDKYWLDRFKMFTKKEQESLLNSIGNLLPLSKPKNSSLQNKPFPEKRISHKGYVGYVNGSYAEIEVAQEDEWTPKQILDRGIRLLDFIEKRWKIKLGNKNDKIKLLGLEEISKKILMRVSFF